MRKIVILIPVFNDWESVKKLIVEINENISNFQETHFECLIVNDASTIDQPKLIRPSNIKNPKVMINIPIISRKPFISFNLFFLVLTIIIRIIESI